MTVNITITEQEENDILKNIPDYKYNSIEKRVELARSVAKKCNISFELIDSVTIEGMDKDWMVRAYDKRRDACAR